MRSLLLGARLTLVSGRTRLVTAALAIAFAVAFLLAALGALPAKDRVSDRLVGRETVWNTTTDAAHPPPGPVDLFANPVTTWWRGQVIDIRFVAGLHGGIAPPGVTELPAPGEMVVSPALRSVLRGPHRGELARRLPWKQTATIGRKGLAGPRELYAYVGVKPDQLRDKPMVVTGFGRAIKHPPTPPEIRAAALLGGLGLLLPVLVFVATATRLSSASRDRRLAALRLVGATPKQVRQVVAGEGLVFGVLGVVVGLLVFLSLRPVAASLVPLAGGVYAEDLLPTPGVLAAVLVGVPALSVLAALVSMRKVVTSPLGVRRAANVKGAGWVRLLPLGLGIGVLALMAERSTRHDRMQTALLLVGGGLCLVGLAVAASAVSRAAGVLLERAGKGLGASLAGRRINADPSASARVVTGTVLVVFVAAWLLAFLPALQANSAASRQGSSSELGRSTLQVRGLELDSALVASLRKVTGVRAVLQVSTVALADGAAGPSESVAVASCQDLAAFAHRAIGCTGASAYRIAGDYPGAVARSELPRGVRLDIRRGYDESVAGQVVLPATLPPLEFGPFAEAAGLDYSVLLVEPGLLPAAARPRAVTLAVSTDGTRDAAEAARAALPLEVAYQAVTLQEMSNGQNRVYLAYLRAARLGIVLALLVGAASLAVTTADSVQERRRSTAALVALGTPLRLLRRAVLLQMSAPLIANVLVALAAAAAASALYLSTFATPESAVPLPWIGWGLTAAGSVLVVLLATCATLPLINAAGRPEALRTE